VTEVATRSSESPYKGLARYEEEDAPYFFGRDADAELVVANLLAARLTLLFGESGVGKSSLLHAGVAPRLRGADDLLLVVFSDWRGDAASSLAAALREASGLDAGPVDLVSTITACAAHSGRDLVVVLDQFEEYFVYHPDEDVEDTFALEFPRAVTQADLPVTFMIAIREDALARLERFKGRIPGLFETYLRLDRLDRDAAREAIVAPLKRHAAVYPDDAVSAEPVLVEQVLDEVEVGRFAFGNTGAGSLDGAGTASGPGSRPIEAPYLQLVLSRLWDEERRAGSRQLRLETLERLGGAERIVRTHLDDALNALSADEQELAASVFRYLVTPSGTKIAHRVDDLAEYAGAQPAAVASVLGKLAAGSTRVVRPAGEDAYEIYHDVLAGAVLDWRARYLHDCELAAAEGRRRLRSRLVLAALVLAIVAGAAAGITIWRVQAGHTDDAKRREQAQALELALAVPFTRAIFTGHREPLQSVAFSPDGRRVASAGQGGDVRIWDWNPTTGRGTEIAALHPGGEVLQATFDPSGELLATAGTTGEAIVWRWESGERLAYVEEPFGLDGAAWDHVAGSLPCREMTGRFDSGTGEPVGSIRFSTLRAASPAAPRSAATGASSSSEATTARRGYGIWPRSASSRRSRPTATPSTPPCSARTRALLRPAARTDGRVSGTGGRVRWSGRSERSTITSSRWRSTPAGRSWQWPTAGAPPVYGTGGTTGRWQRSAKVGTSQSPSTRTAASSRRPATTAPLASGRPRSTAALARTERYVDRLVAGLWSAGPCAHESGDDGGGTRLTRGGRSPYGLLL
jgi:hypothetical protein